MMNNIEGRMMLNQKRTIDEQLIPKVFSSNMNEGEIISNSIVDQIVNKQRKN
jgi:hypothetical protein